jgi:hypothetical protein
MRSLIPVTDFKAFPFRFSYPRGPSKKLCASIGKTGILTPLLVIQSDTSPFILDGHRRLFAARVLKLTHVPVSFLTDTSSENLPRIWLQAQRVFRTLNPFEMALFIKKGRQSFNQPARNLLTLLNSVTGIKAPESLPEILALPLKLRQTAIRRAYSMRFLLKISALYPADLLAAISNLLVSFSLGENQMNNLLGWVREISLRDHLPPEDILKADDLSFILRHPGMPSAKKRDAFLKHIFSMRFPERAALEKKFNQIARKLDPLGIKCVGPDLSGDAFELRITFKNPEEFRESLKKAAGASDEISRIFKLIK